jgi:hypothetical protein
MRVNSLGRDDRRVAEPLLDVLHRDTFVSHQSRAGMAKVVEANEIVRVSLLEEAMEGVRYPSRLYPLAVRPKINVSAERVVVSRPLNLLEVLPLGLHSQPSLL